MADKVRSEDVLGEKYDTCIADTLVKTASGFLIGATFAAVLFKFKKWPMAAGTGIGFGYGLANCQANLRQPLIPVKEKKG